MKRMLAFVLVMVLLAFTVPMAVTPAAAYEEKIAGDADENGELTKDELVNAILPYMLDEGDFKLDDVGDAAYIYAYWDGEPRTIKDRVDRTVTLYKPLERVVSISPEGIRIMMALGELDKLVAKPFYSTRYIFDIYPTVFPESKELPIVSSDTPEFIVSLEPDVIFIYSLTPDQGNDLQEKTGIPVVSHKWIPTWDHAFGTMELVGKVLGKEKEIEDLISYCNEKIDKVAEVTSQINESEKPRVFFVSRLKNGDVLTHVKYDCVDTAGGILVTKGYSGVAPQAGGTLVVSLEYFIKENPDIILVSRSGETPGTSVDDILSDYRFQTMDAVKNRKVYYTLSGFTYWMNDCPRPLTEIFIMAKLFHSDKFEDLDLEAEGNEIFKRFYGVDGYWTELGTKCGYI